jgi:hypothetical protein
MSDANAVGKMRCKGQEREVGVPGLVSWSLASPGKGEAQTGVSFRSHRGTLVVVEKNQNVAAVLCSSKASSKAHFCEKEKSGSVQREWIWIFEREERAQQVRTKVELKPRKL